MSFYVISIEAKVQHVSWKSKYFGFKYFMKMVYSFRFNNNSNNNNTAAATLFHYIKTYNYLFRNTNRTECMD